MNEQHFQCYVFLEGCYNVLKFVISKPNFIQLLLHLKK